MYKKALIFILDFLVAYIISVSFAQIINFMYIIPFISTYFFFESAVIFSFFDRFSVIHLSFLLGLLSDAISLNRFFIFSALFPASIFISEKIFYELKLEKYPVCLFFYLVYAVFMYMIYSVPIVVLLFLFVLTYLFCILLNYLFYRINVRKRVDGEER